jgi:hypothetical protein
MSKPEDKIEHVVHTHQQLLVYICLYALQHTFKFSKFFSCRSPTLPWLRTAWIEIIEALRAPVRQQNTAIHKRPASSAIFFLTSKAVATNRQ